MGISSETEALPPEFVSQSVCFLISDKCACALWTNIFGVFFCCLLWPDTLEIFIIHQSKKIGICLNVGVVVLAVVAVGISGTLNCDVIK